MSLGTRVPQLNRAFSWVSCLLIAASVFTERTKAEPVEIQGVIFQRTYVGQSQLNTASNCFSVIIDGDNSRIKTGPMGDPRVNYFEYGVLGSNSYVIIHYLKSDRVTDVFEMKNGKSVLVKLKSPQKPENDAEILLNNGRAPDYDVGLISPVWMAFCFKLDLGSIKTHHIQATPIFSMGDAYRERGGLAEMTFTLNTNSPNCLRTLIETGDYRRFADLDLPSPSRGVFTNAIYEVLDWTNAAGFAIPQHFRATYHFVTGPFGAANVERIGFEGIVTNIIANVKAPAVFSIPMVTMVVEKRSSVVGAEGQYSYMTTNGIIMSHKELLRDQNFAKASNDSTLAASTYLRRRIIIYIIFGVLALLPFVFWRYVIKKR